MKSYICFIYDTFYSIYLSFMQPSMCTLSSPSSRIVKDSTPFCFYFVFCFLFCFVFLFSFLLFRRYKMKQTKHFGFLHGEKDVTRYSKRYLTALATSYWFGINKNLEKNNLDAYFLPLK